MKRTNFINIIAILQALILMCTMITGCSSNKGEINPSQTGNMLDAGEVSANLNHYVYLVDRTLYAPGYDYQALLEAMIHTNYSVDGSSAAVIRIDGKPSVVFNDIYRSSDKLVTAAREEKNRALAVKKVVGAITDDTLPVAEEVNVIAALRLAVEQLESYDDGGNMRVIMIGSGLKTTSPLNMTAGIDNIDIEAVTSGLISSKEMPRMEGISVDLYGLGKITLDRGQEVLSALAEDTLKEFYRNLFVQCGVSDLQIHSNVPDGLFEDNVSMLPYVSPVRSMGAQNSFVTLNVENNDMELNLSETVVQLPEGTLNYKPGSAELLTSDEEVNEILTPVVNWMVLNPDKNISVFSGTASCGSEEELQILSQERAETVKQKLIGLGIAGDRIETYPLGYRNNPYHVDDVDVNGVFMENEAKKNRVTYITSSDSSEAEVFYRAISGNP